MRSSLLVEEVSAFAQKLAPHLKLGHLITLHGPLGAGKTTFVRALIHSLVGPETQVTSPTFSLVHSYDTQWGSIHHADLYRLETPEEFFELGLLDTPALTLIEWPEKIEPYKLNPTFSLFFDHTH